MTCTLCPLSQRQQLGGVGPDNARLILVGGHPSQEDFKGQAPFSLPTERSGKRPGAQAMLPALLRYLGLGLDEVYRVHALRCNPHASAHTLKPAHLRTCRERHLEPELGSVEADFVWVLGPDAAASLLPDLTGGVFALRGEWHTVKLGGRWRRLRVTFDLGYVNRCSLFEPVIKNHQLERAGRWNPPGSVGWFFSQDLRALKEALEENRADIRHAG